MGKCGCNAGAWVVGLSVLGVLAGCAAGSGDSAKGAKDDELVDTAKAGSMALAPVAGTSGSQTSAGQGGAPSSNTPDSSVGAVDAGVTGECGASSTFKAKDCLCNAGDTAACWTGSPADRNVGKCHDGLQICETNGEFSTWGPCMGEQLDCGSDAGMPQTDAGEPPPPPPSEDCPCVPGAVIQCSEDCSTGIICSLTASKTCLPDGTWSTCREDETVTLDLPGFQCRNMLHGCLDILDPAIPGAGQAELFVGDCSTQFTCGHSPVPN